jgi:hypothetical protein
MTAQPIVPSIKARMPRPVLNIVRMALWPRMIVPCIARLNQATRTRPARSTAPILREPLPMIAPPIARSIRIKTPAPVWRIAPESNLMGLT